MCKVLSNNHNSFWDTVQREKKHPFILITKIHNLKSFNLIFTKKYTDQLTIIRNDFINLELQCDMWKIIINCFLFYLQCPVTQIVLIWFSQKKYTDCLTIIRNSYLKFQEIWISCSQVTVRHVYNGPRDRWMDRRTFVYLSIGFVKILTGI